ncbi:MAG: hypothetical protein U1F33_08585 [Alphaproteobacteria bacterium]
MVRAVRLAFWAAVLCVSASAAAETPLPIAATGIRPLSDEITLLYRPVSSYQRTVTVNGAYTLPLLPGAFDLAAESRSRGSIAKTGSDLAWDEAGSATLTLAGQTQQQAFEQHAIMTPAGQVKDISLGAQRQTNTETAILFAIMDAFRPRNPIRQGQEVWSTRDLPQAIARNSQDVLVKRNTLTFKALGLAKVAGSDYLVVESRGGLETDIARVGPVNFVLPGQCLVDLATGLCTACDLKVNVRHATNPKGLTANLRLRSATTIAP